MLNYVSHINNAFEGCKKQIVGVFINTSALFYVRKHATIYTKRDFGRFGGCHSINLSIILNIHKRKKKMMPVKERYPVSMFQSDFRLVADYFTNAYSNPDYTPDPAVITHVDEFLKLMKVLTGDNRYEAITFTKQEKKEGVKMCKVLDFREKRGEQRGKKAGEKSFRDLLCVLSKQGYQLDEILTMTAKEEDVERLYKQYKLA